jgi:hypothetical protein
VFIGVYLCVAGLFLVLSLLFFPAVGQRLRLYTLLSILVPLAGLALFIASSAWLEVIKFGVPQSYSYPGDYLARGLLGWAAMLIPILGVLFPLALAFWLSRKSIRGEHV